MTTLCFALLLAAVPAASAKSKASKVDAARASANQIRAELNAVTAKLQAQQARSSAAKQASVAADARLRTLRAEEAAVSARLEGVKHSARQVAVAAYMHGGPRNVQSLGSVYDVDSTARANYLRATVMGSATDVADALTAARQDLNARRVAAEGASLTASDRRRALTDAVNTLRASRERQLQLAAAAESRLSSATKEADAFARAARAARIARPSGASRASRGSSGSGSVALTTVRGITVATSIAGNLGRMLSAGDGDGLTFGGAGYRSSDAQVATRRRNCGSSSYDIYDKPPGQCHPPTARPGSSMHEQGLAVDFTCNGGLIQSRGGECYRWLSGHAASYGFYNLPSEAWHWSVNGN